MSLPKTVVRAVTDLAKVTQPTDSWERLEGLLLEEGISLDLINREKAAIVNLFKETWNEIFNAKQFRNPPSQHVVAPPSPPGGQPPNFPQLCLPSSNVTGITGIQSDSNINPLRQVPFMERIIILTQDDTKRQAPRGCEYATDRHESYISDDVVSDLRLEVDNEQKIRLDWSKPDGFKTIHTTCIVKPSWQLPKVDISFGLDYMGDPQKDHNYTNSILRGAECSRSQDAPEAESALYMEPGERSEDLTDAQILLVARLQGAFAIAWSPKSNNSPGLR